jgi:hypothetical protein
LEFRVSNFIGINSISPTCALRVGLRTVKKTSITFEFNKLSIPTSNASSPTQKKGLASPCITPVG